MAKKEDIFLIMEMFNNNKPEKSFEAMCKKEMGIYAVVFFLYNSKCAVTSKDISNNLNVSTARMAVLLKNMEEKKLIVKRHAPTDARAILVSLSEKGKKFAKKVSDGKYRCMEQIADIAPIEEFERIFNVLKQVQTIFDKELSKINMEVEND